jgi:hypothetical protein
LLNLEVSGLWECPRGFNLINFDIVDDKLGQVGAKLDLLPEPASADGHDSNAEVSNRIVCLHLLLLLLVSPQIPKSLSEEDIFPTFSPFGPLKDVAIIRDKHSGLHRGCAFVTYWSSADAEQAVEALHDKFTFEGGRRPAQVKPAEPSGEFTPNGAS